MQSENIIDSLNKSLTSECNDDFLREFNERIQTYIEEQKWIKKPLSLSPAICSQYGWKCIKSDLLECVTCGAKLSAQQPTIGNFLAYKACLEKILSDLKDSHGKHCPWPLTPSPESFVRMVLMPKEEALNQFLKRIKISLPYQSSCPKIEESVLNDLGFSEYQVSALTKMVDVNNEESIQFGRAMVSLAATGWIITEGSECATPVFKCNSCQRSAWSGSFGLLSCSSSNNENESKTDIAEPVSENSIECDSEITKESPEPPTKKRRTGFVIKKGEPFNPLHEHRPWCLWVHTGIEDYTSTPIDKSLDNAKISSNIPGWKIFIKSLLKNISDNQSLEINNTPSKEQIRNVKNLLEKWTDAI